MCVYTWYFILMDEPPPKLNRKVCFQHGNGVECRSYFPIFSGFPTFLLICLGLYKLLYICSHLFCTYFQSAFHTRWIIHHLGAGARSGQGAGKLFTSLHFSEVWKPTFELCDIRHLSQRPDANLCVWVCAACQRKNIQIIDDFRCL